MATPVQQKGIHPTAQKYFRTDSSSKSDGQNVQTGLKNQSQLNFIAATQLTHELSGLFLRHQAGLVKISDSNHG